ncbi:zinc finger protein 639-like isoform X1 [Rhynchophorus ferrugineus]|uniref:zinc finger protein 639-like isoform X1 n=1 Tax=Rhynchophorus ferrugineus TaxID=354439 RepID=UPI003FCDD2AC
MDILNVCRLCGKEKSFLLSLLENGGNTYMKSLINVEIDEKDGLPKKACMICWNSLKQAYYIQQNFKEADRLLHEKCNGSEITVIKIGSDSKSLLITKERHNENSPTESEGYKPIIKNKCAMCGKQYKYLTTLKRHFILQHADSFGNKNTKNEGTSAVLSNNHSTEETKYHETNMNIAGDNDDCMSKKEVNELKCTECSKICSNKNVLLAHKRNHIQMECTVCGAKVGRYYLPIHMKSHTDGSQKCPICQQVLKNKRTLKFHIDTVHNCNTNHTNSQQICYVCGKNLKCARILKRHLRNLHKIGYTKLISKETPSSSPLEYQCSECGKQFLDRQKYMSHFNNHRKEECPICKQTVSRFNYTKHVRLHSEGPENCRLCGVTCKNSESLRGHMYYTHSTKEYTCSTCDKCFKSNFYRKMHIKLHHTGERNHICDYCGKGFITLHHLKSHIKIHHSQSKPYTCISCDKCFTNIKALLQHERRHSPEGNYTCGICLEKFAKKTDLRTHKSALHKIVEMKRCECMKCGKIFSSEFALKKHIQSNHGNIENPGENCRESQLTNNLVSKK